MSESNRNFVPQPTINNMSEFFGKLTHKLDVETIDTSKGPKAKMTFVVLQPGQWGKTLAFETMNASVITFMADTSIGSELKILGDVTSREYKDRWYTSAYAGMVEICKSEPSKDVSYAAPSANQAPVPPAESNAPEDLPF